MHYFLISLAFVMAVDCSMLFSRMHDAVANSPDTLKAASNSLHIACHYRSDPAKALTQFLLAPPTTMSAITAGLARKGFSHVHGVSAFGTHPVMSEESDEIIKPAKYVASAEALLPAAPSQVFSDLLTLEKLSDVFLFSSKMEADSPQIVQDASVKELAGLPPILPLQLTWTCNEVNADDGVLEITSEGAEGIFKDCSRRFVVSGDGSQGSKVKLTTECAVAESAALFALLLRLDNALFSTLLPAAIEGSSRKSVLVWSFLILAWAVSSFGWLALYT